MLAGLSPADLAAIVLALAAVLVRPAWQVTRHLATLVHEAGHATVAVVTGRRLNGIRLHRDTSGLTTSVGQPTGPGMIATAFAGYPAPSVLGLALVAVAELSRPSWALYVLLAALAAMVIFIRNWFGLLVLFVAAGALWLLSYVAAATIQGFTLVLLAWFLMFAGLRTTVELSGQRRRSGSRTSDADVLARLTVLPAAGWNAAFVLAAVTAIALAVNLVIDPRLVG